MEISVKWFNRPMINSFILKCCSSHLISNFLLHTYFIKKNFNFNISKLILVWNMQKGFIENHSVLTFNGNKSLQITAIYIERRGPHPSRNIPEYLTRASSIKKAFPAEKRYQGKTRFYRNSTRAYPVPLRMYVYISSLTTSELFTIP